MLIGVTVCGVTVCGVTVCGITAASSIAASGVAASGVAASGVAVSGVAICGVVLCAAVLVSLPWWLPARIVALRVWLFARINGNEGIPIPGDLVGVERFKEVYSHPAAGGRSKGAALSDLFWYWLSPGPEIHQEHLEAGPRYEAVARATRGFLTVRRTTAEELTRRCVARNISVLGNASVFGRTGNRPRLVRLRDLMMRVWADFYYELVFGEPCTETARELIVANADDVVTALKGCGLRHMERRHRLTRYLADRLPDVRRPLPEGLSAHEQALYLQGTFFNTAVVQMSEAMAHLLMVLAQHPDVQARAIEEGALEEGTLEEEAIKEEAIKEGAIKEGALESGGHADGGRYLDEVIAETLRLYPLFGIAHRITTADIELDERTAIPAGSVLCFNYPEFHRAGFADPGRFDPGRWRGRSVAGRDGSHIPFGVAANRPCPAWRLAPITMRVAAQEVLRRYALASSASHTRSLPNRGPCLLSPRGLRAPQDVQGRPSRMPLLYMRVRDRCEDVWRSLVQLVLGTSMVWDARRRRLSERHFEEQHDAHADSDAHTDSTDTDSTDTDGPGRCPC